MTEDELTEEARQVEYSIAEEGRLFKESGGRGIEKLPGVDKLVHELKRGGARWGIVTSGASTGLARIPGSITASIHFLLCPAAQQLGYTLRLRWKRLVSGSTRQTVRRFASRPTMSPMASRIQSLILPDLKVSCGVHMTR